MPRAQCNEGWNCLAAQTKKWRTCTDCGQHSRCATSYTGDRVCSLCFDAYLLREGYGLKRGEATIRAARIAQSSTPSSVAMHEVTPPAPTETPLLEPVPPVGPVPRAGPVPPAPPAPGALRLQATWQPGPSAAGHMATAYRPSDLARGGLDPAARPWLPEGQELQQQRAQQQWTQPWQAQESQAQRPAWQPEERWQQQTPMRPPSLQQQQPWAQQWHGQQQQTRQPEVLEPPPAQQWLGNGQSNNSNCWTMSPT